MTRAREQILREIRADDAEVRAEYFRLFEVEVDQFAVDMATAITLWESLDRGTIDRKRAFVAALALGAITLHIESAKLFLSGHIIAAGNLFRQVVEIIALTLLCSSHELHFLEHFMDNRYSTHNAIRDVLRNRRRLHVNEDALNALRHAREFYDHYSHPTHLTLANQISFAGEGTYIGACFDPAKSDAYRKEMLGRVGLARVFPNFIRGVQANIGRWPTTAEPR